MELNEEFIKNLNVDEGKLVKAVAGLTDIAETGVQSVITLFAE